ncbi:hypothetical protein AJ80_07779 [Polytolypa hystricis UAMH7299]|uniref:FAD-binding domain-containing protein n=1 Tax=Polytolypa hystricis (strain UAMH7299) TaxID=1447883 RepID=A0A2B7XIY1_POLH7|nr:hypothetical protein AJ80_07779 [Polytolypa hystricis UAMH7299]
MPQQVDVLICGSGSAGICSALWLAHYGVSYKILERRPGRLEIGQADGVQCRTVEVFDSFSIAEDLLKEAYHVLEVAFWGPAGAEDEDGEKKGGIKRKEFAADKRTEFSHQPHVILNQARINELMLDGMQRFGGACVDYGSDVNSVEVVEGEEFVRVVTVREGKEEVFHAKYVLGCDGAHSVVRKSLGFKMIGDSTDSVWGVIDLYPRTNFPDIRKKAILNSDKGNLMIIPREGDEMVRFYIELPHGTVARDVTLDDLHVRARLIFKPYTMDVAETAWWSAYSIGQRRADFFAKDNRVFLTGDACHTHSPKAGQGMNVSLQDGYNIGWKLGAVLTGQASPALLDTYVTERAQTATDLIEFDRSFTNLFSTSYREEHGITAEHFAEQFVKAGRYTAGQATKYGPSSVMAPSEATQSLASNLVVGMRFPSTQVVRFCDARAVHLVKALPSNTRWHIVIFAGDIRDPVARARLDEVSNKLDGIVREFTPESSDPDAVIDPVLVISSKRTEVEQEDIPSFFTPISGKRKMKCLFKTYVDEESYNSGHGQAYEFYGVEPSRGAMVIVRPDQYVAKITSLDGCDSIRDFFRGFLLLAS